MKERRKRREEKRKVQRHATTPSNRTERLGLEVNKKPLTERRRTG